LNVSHIPKNPAEAKLLVASTGNRNRTATLRHFVRNTKKPNSGHFADAMRSLFFPRWTLHLGREDRRAG
jgi:hypothetical protein